MSFGHPVFLFLSEPLIFPQKGVGRQKPGPEIQNALKKRNKMQKKGIMY